MKIVVTGFSGTLGSTLLPILLEDGHQVVGYSRCEFRQSLITPHPNLTKYIGDIRDRTRLEEATRGCDLIFHLAALKRVDTLEECPEEAVKTNIEGTMNILYAQRVNNIPRVVLSSTDKAVRPINVYGNSKAIAEKLVLRNPHNIVCRYGNVLGSRGSVLPQFVKSIMNNRSVQITSKAMTRFWIRPEDAAKFVYHSSNKVAGGLCIPTLKAYPVMKLAILIGEILGFEIDDWQDVGIRAGEKLHEELRTESEGGYIVSSDRNYWFTKPELSGLIKDTVERLS